MNYPMFHSIPGLTVQSKCLVRFKAKTCPSAQNCSCSWRPYFVEPLISWCLKSNHHRYATEFLELVSMGLLIYSFLNKLRRVFSNDSKGAISIFSWGKPRTPFSSLFDLLHHEFSSIHFRYRQASLHFSASTFLRLPFIRSAFTAIGYGDLPLIVYCYWWCYM